MSHKRTTSEQATKAGEASTVAGAPGGSPLQSLVSVLREPTVLNAISGACAGAMGAAVTTPLEVLKTRLQVQTRRKYRTILGSLGVILREEGMHGLYRGLGPTLIALPPNWAIYFCSYEAFRTYLQGGDGRQGRFFTSSVAVNAAAATGAGLVTCCSTNPLWVVKTRFQIQGVQEGFKANKVFTREYKSTFNALSRIAREEGFRGLYSGLGPSIFGVANVTIMLPLYEELKKVAAAKMNKGVNELHPGEVAVASGVAKCVASSITYPHEVVRSRMQISGRFAAIGPTLREIYKEGGWGAFYRGCATNLTRTIPTAAVTFTGFEILSRNLDYFLKTLDNKR